MECVRVMKPDAVYAFLVSLEMERRSDKISDSLSPVTGIVNGGSISCKGVSYLLYLGSSPPPMIVKTVCHQYVPTLTTGRSNDSPLALSFFNASVSFCAPRITCDAVPDPPRYSNMVLSWSPVGGASVTSSSNSIRSSFSCAWWELA